MMGFDIVIEAATGVGGMEGEMTITIWPPSDDGIRYCYGKLQPELVAGKER